jgi:hypothetical protein
MFWTPAFAGVTGLGLFTSPSSFVIPVSFSVIPAEAGIQNRYEGCAMLWKNLGLFSGYLLPDKSIPGQAPPV